MAEYIDKQAAIDLEPPPKHLRQYQTINLDDAYESGWYDAQAVISQLPPADVRPVVLCRDCKEYYFADNRVPEEQAWVCSWLGRVMRHDDFCSLGERKGGDAE